MVTKKEKEKPLRCKMTVNRFYHHRFLFTAQLLHQDAPTRQKPGIQHSSSTSLIGGIRLLVDLY